MTIDCECHTYLRPKAKQQPNANNTRETKHLQGIYINIKITYTSSPHHHQILQIEVRKGHVSKKTHSNSWKFRSEAEVLTQLHIDMHPIMARLVNLPTYLYPTPEIEVVKRPPTKGKQWFFERLGWLNGTMNPRLAFCMTKGSCLAKGSSHPQRPESCLKDAALASQASHNQKLQVEMNHNACL